MDTHSKINGQSIDLDYCDANKASESTRFPHFDLRVYTKTTSVSFAAAARKHIVRTLVILIGTTDAHQHHQNTTRGLLDNSSHFFACQDRTPEREITKTRTKKHGREVIQRDQNHAEVIRHDAYLFRSGS